MARAEAIKLGPFVGGMNTASDPTTVADSELVDCVNFELDLDGSLVQRPPFVEIDTVVGSFHNVVIGNAVIAGVSYILASNNAGVYAFDGTTWFNVKIGLKSSVALQYRDKVYIVATEASAQAGGYWDPGGGFVTQAAMPRGEAAIFNKARMFIVPGIDATVNTSRLSFSDPIVADVFTWPGANIIDVQPGDGQKLIDLVVYNDNLMLFKQDSTYVLAYDLQISDAILRNVNPNIGATSRYCTKTFENSVYVYHEGNIYEINNYDYSHINIKVPFVLDETVPVGSTRVDKIFLSLVGDRLVIRYFNRVYVYGLKTKTWSRWESKDSDLHNFGPLVAFPVTVLEGTIPIYYAGSSLNNEPTMFFVPDGYETGVQEESLLAGLVEIESFVLTKNYDMTDSHHFKKLMWWGADLLTNRAITAFATPVVVSYSVTWYDLSTYTWNQVSANTWHAPLLEPVTVETDVPVLTNALRKFIKFRKAMRFRQINFKLILKGDGSPASGPCRIFSFTALVSAKQVVSKQVS